MYFQNIILTNHLFTIINYIINYILPQIKSLIEYNLTAHENNNLLINLFVFHLIYVGLCQFA